MAMDRDEIEKIFLEVDKHLESPAQMFIYGAAAFILLGEEGRTSIDVDVAGPYCAGDVPALRRACEAAGIPINPPANEMRDHIEWIGVERLSLPQPDKDSLILWSGKNLTVQTVSAPALVASKLIRYDETDQADIRSLCFRMNVTWEQVRDNVRKLPPLFRDNLLVKDNLKNLQQDMLLWGRVE